MQYIYESDNIFVMATIRNLKIFAEVYRTGNITKAAERLYLTQPAVSRAVIDLEKEYNVRLFERYHRHLLPTDAAHHLYTYSLQITGALDELDRFMRDSQREKTIRIGSTITIGNTILPSFVPSFTSLHPDTNIQVFIANGSEIQKKLLVNELDIALIEDSIHEEDLTSLPFKEDELLLVLPLNHPLNNKKEISLSDITEYPLLLREPGSANREYLDNVFSANHLTLTPVWQSVSNFALIEAVRQGIGISILPAELVKDAAEKKEILVRRISSFPLKRTYYIVRHRQKFIGKTLQELIDSILSFH